MLSITRNSRFCWICGKDISLEHCITDEHGLSVHQSCNEKRLLLKAASRSEQQRQRQYKRRADGRTREDMDDGKFQPILRRTWRVIAEELIAETNPDRIIALSLELNGVLDKQKLGENWRGDGADNSDSTRINQWSDYEKIVDDAMTLMGSDYASLQMLFPERGPGGELQLLAFRGFNPEAAKFWEWVRADSKSTCGIALRDKKRVVAPDIACCDFMAGSEDQQVYLQTGIHSCQTTPLIGSGGNVLGMIYPLAETF